jgi:Spy/CpxP family protein refolding chaperone
MTRFHRSMVAASAALAVFAMSSNLSAQTTTAPTNPSSPAASPAPQSPSAQPMQQGAAIPEAVKPLFEGITLTDAQAKQVASIATKHLSAPSAKPDSAGGMGAGAVDHKAAAAKELRTVLTPEQQKTFDANVTRLSPAWGKAGS